MSSSTLRFLLITASRVSALRLMLSRAWITTTPPSIVLCCASRPVCASRKAGNSASAHAHIRRGAGSGVGESGAAYKRSEQDLLLVRVLRQPRDLCAAVDHALLHLEDDAHAAGRRIARRHVSLGGCAHKPVLDAAHDAKLIGRGRMSGEARRRMRGAGLWQRGRVERTSLGAQNSAGSALPEMPR